jgi:hypothetical protein
MRQTKKAPRDAGGFMLFPIEDQYQARPPLRIEKFRSSPCRRVQPDEVTRESGYMRVPFEALQVLIQIKGRRYCQA